MDAISIFGWIAAALVLSSFYLRTMLPLRVVAIGSNLMFITYAILAGAMPILVLHCLLLPLNGWRLYEMLKLRRRFLDTSPSELAPSLLLPFMQKGIGEAGSSLFDRGDHADKVYFILRGELLLQDGNKHVVAGELLGLTGVFSTDQRRTDSAVCLTDVEYGVIAAGKFWELLYQEPTFSNYVIRSIVQRQLSSGGQKVMGCQSSAQT